MLDKCFNPSCGKPMRYLRDGRVVRLIRREGDRTHIQHYWLCGDCYDAYDFVFPQGGDVVVEPRVHAHSEKVQIGDVLLMSRAS